VDNLIGYRGLILLILPHTVRIGRKRGVTQKAKKGYYRLMPKRTFQPKTRRRAREHGFLKRMSSKAGRNVLKRRRIKQRSRLSA